MKPEVIDASMGYFFPHRRKFQQYCCELVMVGVRCKSRLKSHPNSCMQSDQSESRRVDSRTASEVSKGEKLGHEGHKLLVNKLLLRFPKPHKSAYPITLLLVWLVCVILLGPRLDG